MNDTLDIRRSFFLEDIEFEKLVELQNIVYKDRGITFNKEGFKKWYIENPDGKVISFNAFHNDKMVAHYACIPIKMNIGGRIVNGIESMATVTHPDYRGKGLFKHLANLTYQFAKDEGYEFVIGVANANSTPGFIKYFNFTLVSQLDVKIGIGTNISQEKNKIYKRYWTQDTINWRINCSNNKYFLKDTSKIIGSYHKIIQTFMGTFNKDTLAICNLVKHKFSFKPYLYVGLGADIKGCYFKIPKFIKRSPFNLIFMDLTDDGKLPKMTKNNVFFQLIDFDVA